MLQLKQCVLVALIRCLKGCHTQEATLKTICVTDSSDPGSFDRSLPKCQPSRELQQPDGFRRICLLFRDC